jgi:peptidoglycan hydrolase-like protein with peptidoglycan-binding domain
MLSLFCKRNLVGCLVAALAVGTCSVSALAAQSTAAHSQKSAHKSSTNADATPSKKISATSKSAKSGGRKSSKKKGKRVKGQAAPTADRISEIQAALAQRGAFSGTPSGKWDDSTVEAMKKFQASSGLNATGKLDAPTLQKLGLGSETAGLAAPTPPPNSANRLRNLSSLPAEPSN